MKTMRSVLMIALMAIGAAAVANDGAASSRVVVINQREGVYKLIYEAAKPGKVSVKITDYKGSVVFSETHGSIGGFIRPVNFEGMEYGVYSVVIADEAGESVQTINYQSEKSTKNVHIARIAENGKYLVAASADGNEELTLRIFDGGDNLVHNESLTVNGSFGRVYNLTKVAGTPSFEVTDKSGNVVAVK